MWKLTHKRFVDWFTQLHRQIMSEDHFKCPSVTYIRWHGNANMSSWSIWDILHKSCTLWQQLKRALQLHKEYSTVATLLQYKATIIVIMLCCLQRAWSLTIQWPDKMVSDQVMSQLLHRLYQLFSNWRFIFQNRNLKLSSYWTPIDPWSICTSLVLTNISMWMVTLSSCLIWQIISFILSPNEYGCVYAWTMFR